jgi:hypothetical protein
LRITVPEVEPQQDGGKHTLVLVPQERHLKAAQSPAEIA